MAVARKLGACYGASKARCPMVPQRDFVIRYSFEEEREKEQPAVLLLDAKEPAFVKRCRQEDWSKLSDYISSAETCSVDISNLLQVLPNMQDLVESLLNMHHLVELKISNCNITTKMQQKLQFGTAVNLKVLILESLKLRRLHPSIGRLRSLRLLSLQHNHLGDLPVTIRLLRNLEYLDITGNYFRYVPGAVFHLQNLKALEGLNACSFDKMETMNWREESEDIKWLSQVGRQEQCRDQVESLQEAAFRAAVGLDLWVIPLPERYHRSLVECAMTHDLCENCSKSVWKTSLERESDGYTIFVEMAVFCGVRCVPFQFVACSRPCLLAAVSWLQNYQSYTRNRIPRHAREAMPRCEYRLKFLQDLYDYPEEYTYKPKSTQPMSQFVQRSGPSRFRHRTLRCVIV